MARRVRVNHGSTYTPEYWAYYNMLERCLKPHHPSYPDYGGRGISVWIRWRESFVNFLVDVGPKPSSRHTLERLDNSGNYDPGNVAWASRIQQMNNTRNNHRIEINGESKTVREWSKLYDIHETTILHRINRRGMSPVAAVTTPAREGGRRTPRRQT